MGTGKELKTYLDFAIQKAAITRDESNIFQREPTVKKTPPSFLQYQTTQYINKVSKRILSRPICTLIHPKWSNTLLQFSNAIKSRKVIFRFYIWITIVNIQRSQLSKLFRSDYNYN